MTCLKIDSKEMQEEGGLKGINVISGFVCGVKTKKRFLELLRRAAKVLR